MAAVLILLGFGILFGRLMRNKPFTLNLIGKIIIWSIYLLLLLLGISIGTNKEIISNLSDLGVTALIITAFSLAGSILLSMLVYRLFFKNESAEKTEKV